MRFTPHSGLLPAPRLRIELAGRTACLVSALPLAAATGAALAGAGAGFLLSALPLAGAGAGFFAASLPAGFVGLAGAGFFAGLAAGFGVGFFAVFAADFAGFDLFLATFLKSLSRTAE